MCLQRDTEHQPKNSELSLRKQVQELPFPSTLYLTFKESRPSEGHDTEADFIESEMEKHYRFLRREVT